MVNMEILTYGADKSQFIQWFMPKTEVKVKGVIALIHGGFWRQQHDLSLMLPLAQDLRATGWAVANIEYRRADCGGEWPVIRDDVSMALQQVKQHAQQLQLPERLLSIGHSVGGQLALLTAPQVDAVVALAPVTDVVRAYHDKLGEAAAQAFFKTSPEKNSSLFLAASPIAQLPLGCPILLIHGFLDERVPVSYAREFNQRAIEAGDQMWYWEEPLSHQQVIDPSLGFWSRVKGWLEQR